MSSKYTLGLNIFHADSSACLFKDNKLIFATEEERPSRIKHDNRFPFQSIKLCLEEAQINISDIDIITINRNPRSSIFSKIIYSIKNLHNFFFLFTKIKNFLKSTSVLQNLKKLSNRKIFNGKIIYIDHHKSHIYSNFFYNKFKDSIHVSIDGFGDFASTSYGIYEGTEVKIKKKILFPHSLGIFYQAMTQFLGFYKYGDEYKVMGMAGYGKPKYVDLVSKVIEYKNFFDFNLKLDYFKHHNTNIFNKNASGKTLFNNLYSEKLISLLGESRIPNQEILQHHMDLANSVQNIYESILYRLLEDLFQKYKIKNLSLSGGCAMNSLANGKIVKKTGFKNLYVSPNPGDAGGSLGSCLSFLSNNYSNFDNFSAYLGSSYDNAYIKKVLMEKNFHQKFKIRFIKDEDLFKFVAQLLSRSNIVSWFQDRAEWGPRALGNRSILADPRIKNISEFLNKKIKKREDFRPFAPSILEEEVHKWFNTDSKDIPYMCEVKFFRNEKKLLVPAVVHIDGTGRLQTVGKKNNYRYYKLLESFFEITNVPLLLNTSFNENEPIVNSPQHAIDCFERTKIDALVLQNWVVQRL